MPFTENSPSTYVSFENMFNKHLVRKHTSGETCSFCEHCGDKFKNRKDIRKHAAASHEGIIKQHINVHHKGIRYPCDFCEYKATCKSHLGKHVDTQHKGVQYYCDQCDYSTTRKETMKMHEDAVHNNIKHQCPHCDYQAS